jgi:mono/diheme cytochrome c family protein
MHPRLAVLCATFVLTAASAASTIDPVAPASRASFDPAAIRRGAELAAIGNCTGCHTARDGKPYAGGVALATPFGTIYSTNVTPDLQTGIGAWSPAAFVRAMREGVARDGRRLYPAFPYDHFTKVTEPDLEALYAYLMTRDPVLGENRHNALRFPFNFRPLLAIWNALYLDTTPWRPDPAQSAQWNRGAYLVQSLGHCSSCHTPRNALGAEDRHDRLGGGDAEGWYSPALSDKSPSPLPWSVEQLTTYLRNGVAADHAVAGGPMQGVVHELSRVNEEDVQAMAVYLLSTLGPSTIERDARAQESQRRARQGPLAAQPLAPSATPDDAAQMALGASVYQGACASCHDMGRKTSSSGALQLPLAVAVHDPDPRSLIRIIRDGIQPADGEPGRWMPGYGDALTDEQIAALVAYLRRAATHEPAWTDVARRVQEARTP